MWWLWACGDELEVHSALDLSVEVTIPNATAPLVRRLHAEAAVPVDLTARWTSGDHTVEVDFESASTHDHVLLGWRPGRSYLLTVTASTSEGASESITVDVLTDELPAHFPTAEVLPGAGERAPGHTLIPMDSFLPGVEPKGVLMVFDEEGEVCFWLDLGDFVLNAQEWDGGLLALVGEGSGKLVKYTWDGTAVESWSITPSMAPDHLLRTESAENLHHDVQPFPADPTRFVGIARFGERVPDYPASYFDPAITGSADVAIEALVEFDASGNVLREIRLDALLPVQRVGYDSVGPENLTFDGLQDWGHANAVVLDGPDFIVSLRHQDAVVKLDPVGSELLWILGHHDNWTPEQEPKLLRPVGEVQWPFHQHGPRLLDDGPDGQRRIVMFDNGNYQAAPFTGVPPIESPAALQSRVVQFSIDEEAMTVRQDWEFDRPSGGRLYAPAVGEADPLPNGHVLSVWGLLFALPDGSLNADAGLGDRSVRIIEINPAEVLEVEQLYISSARTANAGGWSGYRADRIQSLYGRVVD